jgi:signal transduction histidine kinase
MMLWPFEARSSCGDAADRAPSESELARALFAAAGEALLLVDPPTERVLDVNPMAETLSRLPRDRLLHRGLRDIIHREPAGEDWLDCVHQTTTFHGQNGFVLDAAAPPEGIPVSVTVARVAVAEATPLALLTLHDRREQVEAYRLLQRTEAELRRLLLTGSHQHESLGVLAGGIAHDFNNLLTGILGNAGLARLACPAGSPLVPTLEQIENVAVRAADLCKQMLTFAGRTPLVFQPVDVNVLVQETTVPLRPRLARDAKLTFDLAKGLPTVQGDLGQLRQVVTNLLLNASEALNDQPGTIRLTTGLARCEASVPDPCLFAAHEFAAGDYVYVEVADTGVGIPPEILGRIFEPFFTTKFTGRGLGLAAALGIIRSHNGGIHVTSAVGQGTTFRVLIRQR